MANRTLIKAFAILSLAGSSATLAQGYPPGYGRDPLPTPFSRPQRGYQDQQPGNGPRGDDDDRRRFEQRHMDENRDRGRDQRNEQGGRDQGAQRRQQQYNQNVVSLQQQRNQKVQALQQQFNRHQISLGQYDQATRQIDTELNESIAREQRALPR